MAYEEKVARFEAAVDCRTMGYRHEEDRVSDGSREHTRTVFSFAQREGTETTSEIDLYVKGEAKELFTPGKHYLVRIEAID